MDTIPAKRAEQSIADAADLGDGYTREELKVLLQEGRDSGLCDDDFETMFTKLYFKSFGRYPLEEDPAFPPGRK